MQKEQKGILKMLNKITVATVSTNGSRTSWAHTRSLRNSSPPSLIVVTILAAPGDNPTRNSNCSLRADSSVHSKAW